MFHTKFTEKVKAHVLYLKKKFLKYRAACEVMWENMVQPGRPQMTIKYGACALRAGQAHSEYVVITAFSTATMFTRTRLNITSYFIRTLPVLFKKPWLFHDQEELDNVFFYF